VFDKPPKLVLDFPDVLICIMHLSILDGLVAVVFEADSVHALLYFFVIICA